GSSERRSFTPGLYVGAVLNLGAGHINNTIKVIKRRAYGYRDQEYFFLKIRSAFPGIPR
ncbi:transposase, ISL3 family, partial [Bordetella holmesii H620]